MIKIEFTESGFSLIADRSDDLKELHKQTGGIFRIDKEMATSWQVKRVDFSSLVPKNKSI